MENKKRQKPFLVVRKNKTLKVKRSLQGVQFEFIKYSNKLTATGTPEVETRIQVTENIPERLWDIIDGITQPDLLHPVYKDINISPFGIDGNYWLHIRWEGWHEEEIKQKFPMPEKYPEILETVTILKNIKSRIEKLQEKGEKLLNKIEITSEEIENYCRLSAYLLLDLFSELLPVNPWTLRGFLPLPFRRITIGKFQNQQKLSIRLSPQETRRLSRFLRTSCVDLSFG